MSTTDSRTDRVMDPATPSGTLKGRLGSVTMPNGDSPATPPSTNAVSPAVDNSEVTNARVEEILLSDARSPPPCRLSTNFVRRSGSQRC